MLKVQNQRKEVKNEIKEKRHEIQEKYEKIDKQVSERKIGIIQEKQMIAEKHRLHERDALINNQRIQTLKNIRNFKILEKHVLKEKVLSDYNASVSNLSRFK